MHLQLFVIEQGKIKAQAQATSTSKEFIVLKGSKARREGFPSWTAFRKGREKLVNDRKLVISSDPELYEFAEDFVFHSPSIAAVAVLGRNPNGRTEWKVQGTRQTYQQRIDQQLK